MGEFKSEGPGENTEPRAHLDYAIASLETRQQREPIGDPLLDQEVLTEIALQSQSVTVERVANEVDAH